MTHPSKLRACPRCEAFIERSDKVCFYCGEELAPPAARAGSLLARPNLVTLALVMIIGTVFLLEIMLFGMRALQGMHPYEAAWIGADHGGLVIYKGQYWRLLTCVFLHFGLMHIAFNGYALWQLGPLIERFWGRARTVVCFLGTGFVASAVSVLYSHAKIAGWLGFLGLTAEHYSVAAGASGAIFGILGALLGLSMHQKGLLGTQLTILIRRWTVICLAFGIIAGFMMPIGNAAHVGGLVAGFLFGRFIPNTVTRPQSHLVRKIWWGLAVVAVLGTLLCAALAVRYAVKNPKPRVRVADVRQQETPTAESCSRLT